MCLGCLTESGGFLFEILTLQVHFNSCIRFDEYEF